MRKILMAMFLVFILILGSSSAFAYEEEKESSLIKPCYVATLEASSILKISSNTATAKLTLLFAGSENVDRATATIKIVNHKTGNVVKTWSNVALQESVKNNTYTIIKQHKLSSKGTYHIAASVKVYSGSKLKETISLKSLPATY
ncbi:MAG: hypothetical protein ACLU83_07830 [Anaerovoracaceae bacterium]